MGSRRNHEEKDEDNYNIRKHEKPENHNKSYNISALIYN